MATPRTTVGRRRQRASYDLNIIKAILDETFICTVSYVRDGSPRCVPTSFARAGDELLLHGSARAGWLSELAGGSEVCISVFTASGIVLDSTMLHHSVNYRSVVIFGTPALVTDPLQQVQALAAIVDHVVPGRSAQLALPSASDLKQTQVVTIPITEASAKIRNGGPTGGYPGSVWCGQIPMETTYGMAIPQDEIAQTDLAVPDYVHSYRRPNASIGSSD